MHETTGNIWDFSGSSIIVVTTGGSVARDGRAIMGRGVAKQAAERFPDIAFNLGRLLSEYGNHVFELGNGIVSFPVEETAWSLPDHRIIAGSAKELRELADQREWQKIMVPKPGCGGGNLAWHDVKPLLEPFFDGRFYLISQYP